MKTLRVFLMAMVAILFFAMGALNASAQELKITFAEDVGALDASFYSRKDINGNACALIKVNVVQDCTFKGYIVGDVKRNDDGRYWVYVAAKGTPAKQLIVVMKGHLTQTVKFADYGISVEPLKTYNLTIAATGTIPAETTPQPNADLSNKNDTLSNVARIDISTAEKRQGARIEVDGSYAGTSPLNGFPITYGPHKFTASLGKFRGSVMQDISQRENSLFIPMKKDRQPLERKWGFGLDVSACTQFKEAGFGFGLHCYIKRFDIELAYSMYPEIAEIYSSMSSYDIYYDTMHEIDLKFGYSFKLGRRIRLMPQVGLDFGKIICEGYDYEGDDFFTLCGIVGARCSVTLGKRFQFFVTPEYYFPISADPYEYCYDYPPTGMKRLFNGVHLRAGFGVNF